MTVKEFYEQIGQDYEEVLGRMAGNERLVVKFLQKFCEDSTYSSLAQAVSAGDMEQIFMYAHSLKGVTANLGLKPICEKSMPLVEIGRYRKTEGSAEAFREIAKAYEETIALIQRIEPV